jgi:pyridoxamine 5'-phosphate oxidase family protein
VSPFSADELAYLGEGKLGRLATVDATGQPHVVPVGWRYNAELGTIDIGGRDFEASRKYHHVQANPKVAFVVDDVLPPWRPRCVTIRGTAAAIPAGVEGRDQGALIRITPTRVVSWGLDPPGRG